MHDFEVNKMLLSSQIDIIKGMYDNVMIIGGSLM